MTGPLAGRVALVTGASRGIGAATAVALDRDGARVVLLARDRDRLAAVAGGLRNDPVVLPADLADADAVVDAAARSLAATDGALDVLVHDAAHAKRLPLGATTATEIDLMHAVNVRAPLLLTRELADALARHRRGSVVSVTSVSGLRGTPHRAAYGATKAALDSITRSLAQDLGPRGIRVNAVAPGVVDTDLWAANKRVPGVVEQVEALTPLGRWGRPDDVADVVAFLAGDGARFVTGQTIAVDGGMAATTDLYAGEG